MFLFLPNDFRKFGNLSALFKSKLAHLIQTDMKIIGQKEQNHLQSLCEKSVLREAQKILNDPTHILISEFEVLPFRILQCRLNRYKNSFIPSSIKILNSYKQWSLFIMHKILNGYSQRKLISFFL